MRDKFTSKPGPIDLKKLDFSEFHDLMHTIWKCSGYPGGKRRHLQYAWEFKWSMKLNQWTRCRVGLHRDGQWWEGGLTYTACPDCFKKLSEKQPG